MKKVLFISNHAGFSKFNAPYMQWFHDNGWCVDNVSPGVETGYYDNQYDFPIKRNPFSLSNIVSLRKLINLCKDQKYDIIHCHTPVGGVLGRLCVNIKKTKTKVLYTAHGFHFYKGSSILNWFIFYPIEKLLASRTTCIITINDEDYELALKKFNSHIEKIDGVGVNLQRFHAVTDGEKKILRSKNGFHSDDFIFIYCAQFITRKNHKFLVDKVNFIKDQIPNLKICLVGNGKDEKKIQRYVIKKNLINSVSFMGYRKDVNELYAMSDVLVSTSIQEGFGINIVEGMSCGLPVVCSNIRGHRDIAKLSKENILFDFSDDSFEKGVLSIYEKNDLRYSISKANIYYSRYFSIENSLKQMSKIYELYM